MIQSVKNVLFISACILILTGGNSSAQTSVIVEPGLNTLISALAAHPGDTLILKKGEMYVHTEPAEILVPTVIMGEPFTLDDPEPPALIQMFTDPGEAENMIMFRAAADLTLKNLGFLGFCLDVQQIEGVCEVTAENIHITAEGCIIQAVDTWMKTNQMTGTHFLLRNNIHFNISTVGWDNFGGFGGPTYGGDSITNETYNCTYFVGGRTMASAGTGPGGSQYINHNTYINTFGETFHKCKDKDFSLTNCILYNTHLRGYVGLRTENNGQDTIWGGDYISYRMRGDTLNGDFAIYPHLLDSVGGPREVNVSNNLKYNEHRVLDWNAANNVSTQPFVTDAVLYFADRYGWTIENNWLDQEGNSYDPQFEMGVIPDGAFEKSWAQRLGRMDPEVADIEIAWRPGGEEQNVFLWPLPFDFTPTNEAILFAGNDGYPLGDLNWFGPEVVAAWEAGEQNPLSPLLVQNSNFEPLREVVFYHPQILDTILLVNRTGHSMDATFFNAQDTLFNTSIPAITLPPGDTGMITVSFNPADSVIFHDTLTILTDGPDSISIEIPLLGTYPPEIVWREINNITCGGNSDGSSTIAPIFGKSPYTIKWRGNSEWTDTTLTNMDAGEDYWVEVTDSRGWQVRDTIVLTEPDAITATAHYSDSICLNSSNGFIHITTTGGIHPYTYVWSNGMSGASLNDLEAGIYTVDISDSMECRKTEEYIIKHVVPFGEEEICVVTNDLIGENNLVVWESTPGKGIAHYNVYRETELIGMVSYDALSVFADGVANAGSRPYLYYISVTDTCGNESPKSPYHKPLFLQHVGSNNAANFQWDPYTREDKEMSFDSYTLFRGTDSVNLVPIAQNISPVVNIYTDTDPVSIPGTYYYRIAGVITDPCDTFHYFFSNRVDISFDDNTGISMQQGEDEGVHIYPNPFHGKTTIVFPNDGFSEYSLIILDMTGRIVLIKEGIRKKQITFKPNNLKPGVYHLELRGAQLYRGTMIVK